jgi:hypothetical protein
MSEHHSHGSHVRFYVVMTTLVVLGIVALLVMNDNSSFLTGLTVSGAEDNFGFNDSIAIGGNFLNNNNQLTGAVTGFTADRELDINLNLNSVPTVSTLSIKVKEMNIKTSDFLTKITVNNDRLELNNVEEVTLSMEGFSGSLNFNDETVSINGNVGKFSVNGVTLSSKVGLINIQFEELPFSYLQQEGVEYTMLDFPRGDGTLRVAEKLDYKLEQDRISMNYFNGNIEITNSGSSRLVMDGVGRGVAVSGSLLNFNLG